MPFLYGGALVSNVALTWAFHLPMKDPSAKAVLVAIADHAGDDDRCWPSAPRLALFTSLSERTVRSAIDRLAELGAIELDERVGRAPIITVQRHWRPDPTPAAVAGATPAVVAGVEAKPLQQLQGCDSCTPATAAGVPLQLTQPTPATDVKTPAAAAAEPITPNLFEPSDEPSRLAVEVEERAGDFGGWWAAYPRKVAKGSAVKAYAKALRKAPADALQLAVEHFGRSMVGKDPDYIPHAATWLNGERWLDDYGSAHNGKFNGSGHHGEPKHRDGWAAEVAATLLRPRDDDEPF